MIERYGFAARAAGKRETLESLAEEIGQARALELLAGKITIQMIAANGVNRYRYKGVPVTEEQFDMLMKASGFDTGRVK